MNKFTITNFQVIRAELQSLVEDAATTMYGDAIHGLQDTLGDKLKATIADLFKLKMQIPEALRFDATQHHDKVIKHITTNFAKEDRTIPYKYAALTRLKVLLNSIITSKVKLRFVAKQTLVGLIEAELNAPKGRGVTMSEVINKCPLKCDLSINSLHNSQPDAFQLDELKCQFIAELCQLDLADMKVSDHTHMLAVPTNLAKLIAPSTWARMWEMTQLLNKKTILTEPAPVAHRDLVTRSSWYYKTPALSADLIDTITALQATKYQFVDNALDLIEDAYKQHLMGDDGKLPANAEKWMPARVAFFKEQIQASIDNGGHYVPWSTDSATRMYAQAEIGHMQTSPALRALVKVANITNKIKYDFRDNVVQMYSLLLKTRGLAKYVYLVPEADRKQDLRLLLAETLNTKLECDVFTKDNIKPLFMVWAYNAGKDRILDGVSVVEAGFFGLEHVSVKVAGLIALTGAKNTEANRDILWTAFHDTVVELAPEIVLLKAAFKKLIKCNPLTETSWTLPDGTIAMYASAETISDVLFFIDAKGKQHQHTQYRKVIAENAKSAGLLPRVIHSFDAYVARQLVLRGSRLGITIVPNHDSFTFDAEHTDVVMSIINDLFVELLESDYLADVTTELNTSNISLSIKVRNNHTIVTSDLWAKYGKLTIADLAQSEPLDLED